MINDIHTKINTLLDRVSGSRMRTDTLLVLVGFINTCSSLLSGEIAIFSISDLRDLTQNVISTGSLARPHYKLYRFSGH